MPGPEVVTVNSISIFSPPIRGQTREAVDVRSCTDPNIYLADCIQNEAPELS